MGSYSHGVWTAAIVAGALTALVSAGAHASPGDDDGESAPPPAKEPARTATKPVSFDRGWLEPFFQRGPAKQAVEKFRAEDWDGAEAGFARAAKSLRGDEKLAATYLLALSRTNQSDWAGAGKLFEDLYTSYPRLAPYHAYNAARCRLRRGDWSGALDWAAKVPAATVPEAEATLIRIDALRSLTRWSDALAALTDYLTRFPNGPRRAEALFKKAEAMEKSTPPSPSADVVAIYRRVWSEAPLEAWGDRAGDRLEQIAAGLPAPEAALVRGRTAAEMVTRGMVFFDRNRNQESETTLAAALGAPQLSPDLDCKARFYRAQSVWKARQRPRAAPLFDEADWACSHANNRDLHAKALYQGARSWASTGNRDAAIARYQRVEAEHADHSYADDARIRMAELLTDAGDDAGAAKVLAEVPTRYPNGDLLNEALWRLAFGAWRAGHLDEALHWLDENLRLIPHEENLVRGGARPVLEGARLRQAGAGQGSARVVRAGHQGIPAVGLRAAVVHAAPRDRPARRRRAGRVVAQGTEGHSRLVVPARGRSTASRGSCAPSSWRAWARGATPGASWPSWGWRPRQRSTRRRPPARRPTPRGKTSSGSPQRCWTGAASGARRTRFRATA